MAVTISCPQLADAALRTQLHEAVRDVIRRFRPSFESWRLSLFQSQSGSGWDLAISGPRFTVTLPAQSVTLFVIPRNGVGPSAPTGLKIKVAP